MGKKVQAALLLLLMLCACGEGEGSGAAEAETTPVPTQEQFTEKLPEETPEVVYQVQTDYSNYTPGYERPEAQYTRLRETWIGGLEPRDDYGMLYPFVGTALNAATADGLVYTEGYMYGLFDESGRIVCDPVYTKVSRMNYYDSALKRSVDIPMLALCRTENGEAVYTYASLDGSFVTDRTYCYVKGLPYGVLCVEDNDTKEFVLFDFEGNVLMTQDDLKIGAFEYWAVAISGCDSKLLNFELTDENGERADYFIDLEGSIVCGPYYVASSFYGDRAVVALSMDQRGLIDTRGNWVIQPIYKNVIHGHNGTYLALTTDGGSILLDRDGQEIFRSRYQLEPAGYGYTARTHDSRYSFEGEKLSSLSVNWSDVYDTPVLMQYLDGNTELMNILTGATLSLEGEWYVNAMYKDYMSGDPGELGLMSLQKFEDGVLETGLINESLEMLWNGTGSAPGIRSDEITGEEFLGRYGDGYSLYTPDLEPVLTCDSAPTIWNGRFIITDEQCCTCMDREGNVLFCYPLLLPDGDV